MAEVGDHHQIQSKHKTINALLSYAVLQERDGQPQMLDAFLCAARASRMLKFGWSRARRLAAATSTVPCTDEAARDVLDTMLQIASQDALLLHIPTDFWFRLIKRPSLPPVCLGRDVGAHLHVAKAVRGLGDIEIAKAYFLLIWSEWDYLVSGGFDESCASIRGDWWGWEWTPPCRTHPTSGSRSGTVGSGVGIPPTAQSEPGGARFPDDERPVRELKDILLETNIEAVTRASYPAMAFHHMLTQADVHRFSCNIYVQASTSVPINLCLEFSTSHSPHLLLCPHVDFDTRVYSSYTYLTAPSPLFPPSQGGLPCPSRVVSVSL